MFWMIVTRFFCKTEKRHDFPCTLKAGIFKKKKNSLLSLKSVFDFFHYTRSVEDKARYIWKNLEIIESVVSSPFV